MTEPTIWESLHRPVLAATVKLKAADRGYSGILVGDIAEEAGIDVADTFAALHQFHEDEIVRLKSYLNGGRLGANRVMAVSAEAFKLVGEWPTPESVAQRLIDALEEIAEHSQDPVAKSKARRAADALTSLTRDTLVSVAGAAAGVAMQ